MKESTQSQKWSVPESGHHAIAMPVVQTMVIGGLPGAPVFAKALFSRINALSYKDLPESLSVARIEQALIGLVVLRVMQVRRERAPRPELDKTVLTYPAFMFPVLRSIGDVIDPSDAIELRVVLSDELAATYSKEVFMQVAQTLSDILNYGLKNGLEFATALPKEIDGQVSVLAFMLNEGRLTTHTATKTHADALLRSALDLRFSEYVWGIPRWEYNTVRWYHGQLERVVYDSFRT